MSPFFVKKLMNQRACFLCAEKLPEIDQTGGVCRCLCTSGRQLLSVLVKKRIDGVSAGELKFIVTQITKTNLGYTLQKGSIDKLFRVGKSRSPQQIRSVFDEIQKSVSRGRSLNLPLNRLSRRPSEPSHIKKCIKYQCLAHFLSGCSLAMKMQNASHNRQSRRLWLER